MPITKYNYQVRETADIPRIITEAVHIATTGRPGPVVIDLPKDVSALETDYIFNPAVNIPSYQPTIEPNELQIKKILKQLGKAKKPVLLAGGGVSYAEAAEELVALAERYQIPVVTSLLGQGNDCDKPSSLPWNGRDARFLCGQHCHDRSRFHDQYWLSFR